MDFIQKNENEHFSKSQCNCVKCLQMHASVLEWETFTPQTALQKRMLTVVKKIEDRIKTNPNT